MPLEVCADGSFEYRDGVLGLSDTGVYATVAEVYQEASNDGPFEDTPRPGRIHLDLEVSWLNDTGVPHRIFAEVERGPRLVAVTAPNRAEFREQVSGVVGPNARAPEPDPAGDPLSVSGYIPYSGPDFRCAQQQQRAWTAWYAQDRSTAYFPFAYICEAGWTASFRYKLIFTTEVGAGDKWVNVTGHTAYEARARWGEVRLWAAPWAEE